MPFYPYHRFANRAKLLCVVAGLKDTGNISDTLYENFNRYHSAMIHKLRSAKHNLERLTEKISMSNIRDAADSTSDFRFEVNMFIDGFFYSADSSMDILARVVLTTFGQPLTGNIYFGTAYSKLSHSHPNHPILPKLAPPGWLTEFLDYRNTLTHELIITSEYRIIMRLEVTANQPSEIQFPLPDDPRASPANRTFRRNPNVVVYIKTHFKRILSVANIIYGDIAERANTNGLLPL